jgi:hypothetical protein
MRFIIGAIRNETEFSNSALIASTSGVKTQPSLNFLRPSSMGQTLIRYGRDAMAIHSFGTSAYIQISLVGPLIVDVVLPQS